ncbi:Bcr/CflA family efflux MFS transporter [Colwelliaceae bacterium 6441]
MSNHVLSTDKNKDINKKIILALVILTTTLMTMSTDLFAPSLPFLSEYFNTNDEMVKLTMSMWMMAYGGILLIYGPLSEKFGRRPVLVGAMFLFTLASFFCTTATSIEQLIVARIVQGAAAGAEGVLVMSIVRDCFDEKGQVWAFSIYRGVCALPPIFAPIIGTYIYIWLGWQANFILLSAIAAIVTGLLWKYLDESSNTERHTVSVSSVLKDYWKLLCSGKFLAFTVIMATSIAYLVIFPTVVPFVLVNQLGQEAEVFGYFQGVIMVAFIFGSTFANKLSKKMSVHGLLFLGICIVALGGILLLLVALFELESLLMLGIPLGIIAFGNGPVMAAAPPLAMGATNSSTGSSAAMMLTITSALASATAMIEGAYSSGTSMSLAVILFAVASISLLAFGAVKLLGILQTTQN